MNVWQWPRMQAWKYQPWVQEAINKRLNKLADVAPPTVGFHVRGGDKLAEDKMLVDSNSQDQLNLT